MNKVEARKIECMDLINELREDEGNAVTICCDNPDFNDQPNCKILVCGEHTNWQDQEYTGDTLYECLSKAKSELWVFNTARKAEFDNIRRSYLPGYCCKGCGEVVGYMGNAFTTVLGKYGPHHLITHPECQEYKNQWFGYRIARWIKSPY